MPKKVIRKVASVVNAAMKDADLARKTAHDPTFHREVQDDRRTALSRYKTVQHALRDRAAADKGRAGKPKAPKKTR